jgi:hypothetical protein
MAKFRRNEMDMQHEHADLHFKDMQNDGQAAWTCSKDMQHGDAAWTCGMDMQDEHTGWTCRMDM